MLRSARGAITVKRNRSDDIIQATGELLGRLVEVNSIQKNDMTCILFTMTRDLNAVFPAKAAREMGFSDVPLMCSNEIRVKGGLKKCIRLMICFNTELENAEIRHIYMREAVKLRPDLSGG